MFCAVNPNLGREHEGDIIARSGKPGKIIVVGGGPGGMEVAQLLAIQGHRVSLWEKERDLGGAARMAALAYEPNERLVNYLTRAIKAQVIDIQLGKIATIDNLAAENADHIILATGAQIEAPDIPGKNLRHVFDGDELRGVLMGNDPNAIDKLSLPQRLILKMGHLSQLLRHIGLSRLLSKNLDAPGKRDRGHRWWPGGARAGGVPG